MDKREKMANQLLMRGHATMDELLEASFGEWPPKGLDIALANEQIVTLFNDIEAFAASGKIEMSYGDMREALALSQLAGARDIFVGSKVKRERLPFTLGHEAAHILQGDYMHRGYIISDPTADLMLVGQSYIQDITDTYETMPSRAFMQSARKEHYEPKRLKEACSVAWKKVSPKKVSPDEMQQYFDYFADGLEVQARLHEIMAEGYPVWGRLPADLQELHAALISAGLEPPELVAERQNDDAADNHFSTALTNEPNAVSEINFVQAGLSDEGREEFWKETLPRLYADLIEMYGDKPGRDRFGLGENKIYQARMAFQQALDMVCAQPWVLDRDAYPDRILTRFESVAEADTLKKAIRENFGIIPSRHASDKHVEIRGQEIDYIVALLEKRGLKPATPKKQTVPGAQVLTHG